MPGVSNEQNLKMKRLHKFVSAYKTVGLIIFNTIVLFVLLNLVFMVVMGISARIKAMKKQSVVAARQINPVFKKYGKEKVASVYPGMNEEDLRQLLLEHWSQGMIFAPFTHFRQTPFQGRFVNVDTNGFRHVKNQGPWPPAPASLNIFVFGGSTTFGCGVADHQTIPSQLQEKLASRARRPVAIYNFGTPCYYSTQERILFEQLLVAGNVPDLVVFIDGLNDFYYVDDMPDFVEEIRKVMDGQYFREHRYDGLWDLPLLTFIRFHSPLGPTAVKSSPAKRYPEQPEARQHLAARVCQRYWANQKLIEAVASSHRVKTCFIWQPVPNYKYTKKYHLFSDSHPDDHSLAKTGYEYMADWLKTNLPPANFLSLADMQAEMNKTLYVDIVHYTPEMSGFIAEAIARFIVQKELLQAK